MHRKKGDPWSDFRWLQVLNGDDEDIPAYGVMMMAGLQSGTGLITVSRPNTDDIDSGLLLVNGPGIIKAGKIGQATQDGPMIALFDPGGGVPDLGDSLGTVANEWAIAMGATKVGFLAISEVENSSDLLFVSNRYRALVNVECVDGAIVGDLPAVPI
jgi:hypothetical protein